MRRAAHALNIERLTHKFENEIFDADGYVLLELSAKCSGITCHCFVSIVLQHLLDGRSSKEFQQSCFQNLLFTSNLQLAQPAFVSEFFCCHHGHGL